MNPCIPIDFYSSTFFLSGDWHEPLSIDDPHIPYPTLSDGCYSRLKVLPLQVQLVQRLLDHPSLVTHLNLPPHARDFFFQRFSDLGLLNELNVAAFAPLCTFLDFSFLPALQSSSLLPKVAQCALLTTLHLAHIPLNIHDLSLLQTCDTLRELSIGSTFTSTDVGTEALRPVFCRLAVLRLRTPKPLSDDSFVPQLLSLCSPSNMEHLELDILGPQHPPWSPHITSFSSLRILRVTCPQFSLQDALNRITTITTLESLYLDSSKPFEDVKFADAQRLFAMPRLSRVYVHQDILKSMYTGWKKTHHNKDIELLKAPSEWTTIPIAAEAEYFTSLPTTDSVEVCIRNLRYLNVDPSLAEVVLPVLYQADRLHATLARWEHPLFIPLMIRILRTHAKIRSIWSIVVPIICRWLHPLESLVPSERETAVMEKKMFGMRTLIFEEVGPIIEQGIDAHALDFSSAAHLSLAQQSIHVTGHRSYDPAAITHPYFSHLQLLRFICFVASFPPSDAYPSRLCLSHRPKIARYVTQPWHKMYDRLDTFRTVILPMFNRLENNEAFCYSLNDNGLDDLIEQLMRKWCPQAYYEEPKNEAPDWAALTPLPAIIATLLPRQIHRLIDDRIELVSAMIRMLPYDMFGEWLYPVSIITCSHASHGSNGPHPGICAILPKYCLWSYNILDGELGAHLMAYAGSFCRFCRSNFARGLEHSEKASAIEAGVPLNCMEFMARRYTIDRRVFWKPVPSWVLEPHAINSRWIFQLRDELFRNGYANALSPETRAQLTASDAETFFHHLCEVLWDDVAGLISVEVPYQPRVSNELDEVMAMASLLSQSPVFVEVAWNAKPMSMMDAIRRLVFDIGSPWVVLSLVYHISCYSRETFTNALENERLNVPRDPSGGRQFDLRHSFPQRLLPPLHLDSSTDDEDLLSSLTETLLAGVVLLPRSHIFINLRTLANMSHYHVGIYNTLKEKSRHTRDILVSAIGQAENDGEVLGTQSLVCEIFGELDSHAMKTLPTPIRLLLTKESLLRYIEVGEKCGQPWWESCECFLLRSIFKRALHIILSIDTTQPIPQSLSATQIETVTYLVDALMRLAGLQDITTQEVAFGTLVDILSAPDADLSASPHDAIKMLVRGAVKRYLNGEKYKKVLKEAIEYEHFGYESQASKLAEFIDF